MFKLRPPPGSTLFPYTTLFRSVARHPSRSLASDRSYPWRAMPTTIEPMPRIRPVARSEEHTSELQSRGHHVCRLLLEKKSIRRTLRDHDPFMDPTTPKSFN